MVQSFKVISIVSDMYHMGTYKIASLETITLQNVSIKLDGFDPVLEHVDFELPLDRNVVIQSSNPFHAVQFLQILAGLQKPDSGCVMWNEQDIYTNDEADHLVPHRMVGAYFESQRPPPQKSMKTLFTEAGLSADRQTDLIELFDLQEHAEKSFKTLTFEMQKTVQLITIISKQPQMLILEDPASGLSETVFLEILDLIQYEQRRGHVRHLFFTNHHPTAVRHMDATVMHLEDGLLYVEEKLDVKKVYNF